MPGSVSSTSFDPWCPQTYRCTVPRSEQSVRSSILGGCYLCLRFDDRIDATDCATIRNRSILMFSGMISPRLATSVATSKSRWLETSLIGASAMVEIGWRAIGVGTLCRRRGRAAMAHATIAMDRKTPRFRSEQGMCCRARLVRRVPVRVWQLTAADLEEGDGGVEGAR